MSTMDQLHSKASAYFLAFRDRQGDWFNQDIATQLLPLLQLAAVAAVDGVDLAHDSFDSMLLTLLLRPVLLDG